MNRMQELFDETIKKYTTPDYIGTNIIKGSFNNIGVPLTKKQLKNIKKQIFNNNSDSINITLSDKQVEKSKSITKEDLNKEIKKLFENIDKEVDRYGDIFKEELPGLITEISDNMTEKILKNLKKTFNSEKKRRKREDKMFHKNIEKDWRSVTNILDMMLFITQEIVDSFQYREDINESYKNYVLINMMSKSCLVFSEIITLIKTGHADGAYARWRTLHEISVLVEFLAKRDEELSIKYFLHQNIQIYKAAELNIEYSDKYNYEKITDEDYKELLETYNELLDEYGKEYRHDYGWASEELNNKKPTFRDLENIVDFKFIRPHYKMASNNIHTNSRGLFFKLGTFPFDEELLLSRPSNIGLSDPCSLTSLSIALINSIIMISINENAILDDIVYTKILYILKDEVWDKCYLLEDKIIEKISLHNKDLEQTNPLS